MMPLNVIACFAESFDEEISPDRFSRWKRVRNHLSNEHLSSEHDSSLHRPVHAIRLSALQYLTHLFRLILCHGLHSSHGGGKDMLLLARDTEIKGLISKQATLSATVVELQGSLSRLSEENKVLKKAVAIQDTRLKENAQQMNALMQRNGDLAMQNSQRESVLSQAADYVARLESEHRCMREYIEAVERNGGRGRSSQEDSGPYWPSPDEPPPDVF